MICIPKLFFSLAILVSCVWPTNLARRWGVVHNGSVAFPWSKECLVELKKLRRIGEPLTCRVIFGVGSLTGDISTDQSRWIQKLSCRSSSRGLEVNPCWFMLIQVILLYNHGESVLKPVFFSRLENMGMNWRSSRASAHRHGVRGVPQTKTLQGDKMATSPAELFSFGYE